MTIPVMNSPPPQSPTEPFASGLRADDKHQRGVQAGYERTTSISEECKRATSGRRASARSASGLRADDKHQRGVQAGYERATSGRRASARSASGLQTNKLLKRPRLHFLLASNHIHHHRNTGQILSNALVGYRRGIELIFEMVEHKSSRLHSSGPH